ncbi:MAG TPA: toll/interleukin-1 receptor domain-containing protein [Thermoanaerobaculia bacterium]|jgi:hypothetical protein|nr:toll/interleukin-1 receptor domain-containing protein [Thermoanaerobaculia bacterium]
MADRFTYDVFLSHNARDKPQVQALAEELRAAGLRVWFDEWVIKPGDDIYLAIESGLEAARVQVLCLSQAALGSEWVALERSTVLFRDPTNADRRFIPLLLADCELPDALRRYKYVDYRRKKKAAFAELLASCRPGTDSPALAKKSAQPTEHYEPLAVLERVLTGNMGWVETAVNLAGTWAASIFKLAAFVAFIGVAVAIYHIARIVVSPPHAGDVGSPSIHRRPATQGTPPAASSTRSIPIPDKTPPKPDPGTSSTPSVPTSGKTPPKPDPDKVARELKGTWDAVVQYRGEDAHAASLKIRLTFDHCDIADSCVVAVENCEGDSRKREKLPVTIMVSPDKKCRLSSPQKDGAVSFEHDDGPARSNAEVSCARSFRDNGGKYCFNVVGKRGERVLKGEVWNHPKDKNQEPEPCGILVGEVAKTAICPQ